MSNKFILVPEAMYEGLLTSNVPKENPNLAFTKEKLDRAKNVRRLNKSAKNVLYNQELRRYLKIRKEAEEKPVKVELSDGSKLIQRPVNTRNAGIGTDDENVVVLNNASNGSRTATPPIAETPSISETPSIYEDVDEWADETVREVLERINLKREMYKISPTGEIADWNDMIIPNSDYKRSIKAILSPSPNTPEPPGTNILRTRLKNDRLVAGVVSSINTPTSTKTINRRPKRDIRKGRFQVNRWNTKN